MPSTARHGLTLAARVLRVYLPSPLPFHQPLPRPSTSPAARLSLRDPGHTPTPRACFASVSLADAMNIADGHHEPGSPPDGAPRTEADLSTRPAPQLKPGDSFGSEFYGELNGFSIESPESSQTKSPGNGEDNSLKEDEDIDDAKTEADEEPEPPVVLSYKRKPLPPPVAPDEIPKAIPPSHWSHKIYCGPQGEDVKVHYCYTFEDSERVAQGFLNEPVVGLDMEWYPYLSDDVKKNASVLQLACQDRIAIFHLARHEGKTAAQIVPPSLKRIIESADILKTGVHIDQADGTKLRDWLHLKPKGLFEVSHLYNLLANRRNASGYVLKTSKKMEIQVEEKLGLPLKKGAVRTSNWHKPLTQEQIDYAATDAYAGFMLFHVMNEQRKLLKPTPPRPEFAELRQPIIGIPEDKDAEETDPSDEAKAKMDAKTGKASAGDPRAELHGSCLLLYDALTVKRADLASEKGMKPYHLATNQVLKRVALARPQTADELKAIKGLGEQGIRNFGETMLATIKALPTAGSMPDEEQEIPEDVILDDPIITETGPKKPRGSRSTTGASLDDSTQRLYDALREKRREIAAERKTPTWELHRIANNGVLTDLAKQRPSTLEELKAIKGVGSWSAAQYGPAWLSVINGTEKAVTKAEVVQGDEPSEHEASENEMSDDEDLYISPDNLPPGAEKVLTGERVLFTGILDIEGRTNAQEVARKCGADVLMKADSETTLVVTGREVSETKIQTIEEYSLKTMSERDFLIMIRRKAAEAHAATQRKSPLANLSTLTSGSFSPIMAQPLAELSSSDRPFFNALKAFRTQLSRLSNMPPETICSDADLHTIALARPKLRSDLLRIPCARNLDATARQHRKSVNDFLARHNRNSYTPTPTAAGSASRVSPEDSASDGSDTETAFERRERMAPSPVSRRGEFPTTSASKKRKF